MSHPCDSTSLISLVDQFRLPEPKPKHMGSIAGVGLALPPEGGGMREGERGTGSDTTWFEEPPSPHSRRRTGGVEGRTISMRDSARVHIYMYMYDWLAVRGNVRKGVGLLHLSLCLESEGERERRLKERTGPGENRSTG